MKTEHQILNAYSRAAFNAHHRVLASQTEFFAADTAAMSAERGAAGCAAGFAAQALAKLENGDLDGFLASARLAGQFADKASDAYYARVPQTAKVRP